MKNALYSANKEVANVTTIDQAMNVKGSGHIISQNVFVNYDSKHESILGYSSNNDTPRHRLHIFTNNLFDRQNIIQAKVSIMNRWIIKAQNDDWSMPANDIGSWGCVWATAGLLYSSWIATGETPEWWIKGLAWSVSQCVTDGGAPFGFGSPQRDITVTDATALLLLCLSESRLNNFVNGANNSARWLLRMQRKNGGFPWTASTKDCNVVSTGFAILALRSFLEMSISIESDFNYEEIFKAIERAQDWLLSVRNPDGGWGSEAGDVSRPANTGFIIYILNVLNNEKTAEVSIPFMIESFQNGWVDSIDRPLPFSITRLGLPYSILGLSCLQERLSRDSQDILYTAIDIALSNFDGESYKFPLSNARSWPTRDFMLACCSLIG